jgi:hypothetical protein
MPIERTVIDTARRQSRRDDIEPCLGCPDCGGTCWSVIELDLLPRMVLHPNRTAPA